MRLRSHGFGRGFLGLWAVKGFVSGHSVWAAEWRISLLLLVHQGVDSGVDEVSMTGINGLLEFIGGYVYKS